jgi:2-iminobutanoate/2-iminopropanoate deaminase
MTYGPVDSPDMPKALGPYSPAVRAGDHLFVSGQPGIDPSTGSVPPGGFDAEARQAFVNLRTVVEAAGATLDRVVRRTTVFLTSADDFPALNEVFAEFFPSSPPVRSTPIVGLPRNLRISIDATAYLG